MKVVKFLTTSHRKLSQIGCFIGQIKSQRHRTRTIIKLYLTVSIINTDTVLWHGNTIAALLYWKRVRVCECGGACVSLGGSHRWSGKLQCCIETPLGSICSGTPRHLPPSLPPPSTVYLFIIPYCRWSSETPTDSSKATLTGLRTFRPVKLIVWWVK